MHNLPTPPDAATTQQWVLWLVGIAWLAYTTWQAKKAGNTADAAKEQADTTTKRVNGHADSIQSLQTNQLPPALMPAILSAAAIAQSVTQSAAPSVPAQEAEKANLTQSDIFSPAPDAEDTPQ